MKRDWCGPWRLDRHGEGEWRRDYRSAGPGSPVHTVRRPMPGFVVKPRLVVKVNFNHPPFLSDKASADALAKAIAGSVRRVLAKRPGGPELVWV